MHNDVRDGANLKQRLSTSRFEDWDFKLSTMHNLPITSHKAFIRKMLMESSNSPVQQREAPMECHEGLADFYAMIKKGSNKETKHIAIQPKLAETCGEWGKSNCNIWPCPDVVNSVAAEMSKQQDK